MDANDKYRRQILKMMLSAPLVMTIGCGSKKGKEGDKGKGGETQVPEAAATPADALKKLILVIGPWVAAEKAAAEEFAGRFVASAAGAYLPKQGEAVQRLAKRFPDGTMALDKVDMKELPEDEKTILVELTKQVYSLVEVRFHVTQQPPWGTCPENKNLHTVAPKAAG